MSVTTPSTRPVQGLPDPGERVPPLAWPTVGLFVVALGLVGIEIGLYVAGAPAWVTVPVGATVTFVMFSVMHESTHHAISTNSGLNDVFGRLSTPFVAPYGAFSMLKFIHIEHHRNTNEAKHTDPDAWTSEGPWWQLPFRWATIDAWYVVFYARRIRRRPRREQVAVAATAMAFVVVVVTVVLTGHLTTFVVLVLIPQRIGLTILAWWFDYLPHHGLTITQRQDKYRATRVRVGGEKVLTPLFVYQNYHLVHHLHPSIPFYRYVRAWRRNEAAYLDRDAAISTWFGRSLTPEEYRTWRRMTDPLETASGGRRAFHPLRVETVDALGDDGVRLTFAVPQDLRQTYTFTAGQHVTLRARIAGEDVRRTYSICSSEQSGLLQVAVRRHSGGVFSTYATTALAPGDVLDVLPPNGTFGDPLPPLASLPATPSYSHYVALAAGSGITPVLSVVVTSLESDPDVRMTVMTSNRSRSTEMFAAELDELAERYAYRLRVVRHYSQGGVGRLAPEAIRSAVEDPSAVRGWFLCGPHDLVAAVREDLGSAGVAPERLRSELFTAGSHDAAPRVEIADLDAVVRLSLDGRESTLRFNSAGPTVLEAALDAGIDVPYSCAGGACGTCRAWLVEGTAVMDQNHVLSADEVAAGAVLACQLRPTTPSVHVSFDEIG